MPNITEKTLGSNIHRLQPRDLDPVLLDSVLDSVLECVLDYVPGRPLDRLLEVDLRPRLGNLVEDNLNRVLGI